MPYGLKTKSESKKKAGVAQKSYSFDPVEVEVPKKQPLHNLIGTDDIVDEATSEEE